MYLMMLCVGRPASGTAQEIPDSLPGSLMPQKGEGTGRATVCSASSSLKDPQAASNLKPSMVINQAMPGRGGACSSAPESTPGGWRNYLERDSMQEEVHRLQEMKALEKVCFDATGGNPVNVRDVSGTEADYKRLTTKFVLDWRWCEVSGTKQWVRRARLVARYVCLLTFVWRESHYCMIHL